MAKLTIAAWLALALATAAPAATAGDQTLTVERGDSLYTIVRLQYPDSAESWPAITRDIVALNPQAFRNGDPSSLRVGAQLRLPDYSLPRTPRAPMRVPAPAADTASSPEPEPPRPPPVVVGEVIEAGGAIAATGIDGRQRVLTVGSKIHRGDTILSGAAGGTRLIMNDGAELLLRSATRIEIHQYLFSESNAGASRSTITLTAGGIRIITGLIARRNADGFRLETPAGAIGVRGTDFAVLLCERNGCLSPETGPLPRGAYSGVLDGEIRLANEAGEFSVARGDLVRASSREAVPEPAPEAKTLVFTRDELAMLEPEQPEPMNFLQWMHAWITGKL